MGRAKKFEISQESYELFFIMWIYDDKKQYRVTIVLCTTSYESHTFFHEFAD
jgi:hypothetical protein